MTEKMTVKKKKVQQLGHLVPKGARKDINDTAYGDLASEGSKKRWKIVVYRKERGVGDNMKSSYCLNKGQNKVENKVEKKERISYKCRGKTSTRKN